jgi:GNAT superfamily N-acetyltransferase
VARCHRKADLERQKEALPVNYLAGFWQGMLNDKKRIVFKAQSGLDVVGIGCATMHDEHPLEIPFGACFSIVKVVQEAQGAGIGRRLLACLAGNLFSRGARSAYMHVHIDDHVITAFARETGGSLFQPYNEQGIAVFVWRDLIPVITDAYRF